MSHATDLNRPQPGQYLTPLLLAFITMTGLSYINFLPGVVSALAGGIGFSDVQAGQIVAMNGYGGLLGTTIAIFLVRRLPCRPLLLACLLTLAVLDIASTRLDNLYLMLGWRFIAGVSGGLALGLAMALLARQANPDRAFGALLLVQFSIGSLVVYLLPALEAMLSAHAVFYVMASFSLLSLLILQLLPVHHFATAQNSPLSATTGTLPVRHFAQTLLLLSAMVLYPMAASAIWAYVGLIGTSTGMANTTVNTAIAITGLLGLVGATLPMVMGNRHGRLSWLMVGNAFSVTAAVLLLYSDNFVLYILAMALLFLSWPAVQSYLLAATADWDNTGRLATLAAVVSSIGLATGPLLASALLADGDFSSMLYACAILFLLSAALLFKPVQATEKPATALPAST